MRVSGFTFVRNGIIYDYPFRESIRSVLPLVDEMIVNVPASDDDTYKAVVEMNEPKIKIIQTVWGGEKPSGGRILSHHTNLALEQCSGDWRLYIQADEVIHENDYEKIKGAMRDNLHDHSVDGLLFDYVHFYGSFSCIATARNWYRREIRIIRNNPDIVSYSDAQGFRYKDDSKIPVKKTGAKIYHYGWSRPIEAMRLKTAALDSFHHGNKRDEINKKLTYKSIQYGLRSFNGTHPKVMSERVNSQDWFFDYQSKVSSWKDFRYCLSDLFEKTTGLRLGEYKGYRLKS